ncbi:MAG: type II toxin-antitoxin system Phd/YefM family antitoxin [Candidatus Limnocylindria bacterium]
MSAVLRRIERGERLRVTVHGRPVAELVPLARPRTMAWEAFTKSVRRADAGLSRDLAELMPDTTDDIDLRE